VAIQQTQCTSFKVGLLEGKFEMTPTSGQLYKIALYTSVANLGAATTRYTATGEISGTGYTAGGEPLTIVAPPAASGSVAYLSFANVVWPNATFTARGALIYLVDGGDNPSVLVLDFGADKTVSGQPFTVEFPTNTASSAVLRIA